MTIARVAFGLLAAVMLFSPLRAEEGEASRASKTLATLTQTPPLPSGSFYPSAKPRDADADLVRVEGRDESAEGTVIYLRGYVLDVHGEPISGALVEIWQADSTGHFAQLNDPRRDENFQGYGRAVTESDGGYQFRTVRPAGYSGRPPVIHVRVSAAGVSRLTTQIFIGDDPRIAGDFLLNRIADPAERARLIIQLTPAPYLEPGALTGRFDIVVREY